MRANGEPLCRLPNALFAENAATSGTRPKGPICQKCADKLGLDIEARLLASQAKKREGARL